MIEAHIAEYKAQEEKRAELQNAWTAIQEPNAWKYADFLSPNAGELSSEEIYLHIKDTLANSGDILTLADQIRLLQQRIKDGEDTSHIHARLEHRAEQPRSEASDSGEDEEERRQRLLLDKKIEDTLLDKIEGRDEPSLTDEEILIAWKQRHGLKTRVRNDLLALVTLRGPASLFEAEEVLENLPRLITEYRTRVNSAQDNTTRQRHESVLHQLIFMRDITSMMTDYGIAGTQNIEEFAHVLRDVIKSRTNDYTDDAESIFSEVVEKAHFQ